MHGWWRKRWRRRNLDEKRVANGISGTCIDETLLPHLSSLGWEHINLTGDYIWLQNKQAEQGKFWPLWMHGEAYRAILSAS